MYGSNTEQGDVLTPADLGAIIGPKTKSTTLPLSGATPGFAGGGTVLQQGDPFGVNQANQAYQDALSKLANTPSPTLQETPYKPPSKQTDIITSALAFLFPGAPIGRMAASYLQGAENKSDRQYQQANEEDYKKYQVAENTRADEESQANNLGRVADARAAMEQRAENQKAQHEIALENEQYKREQIDERKRMDNATIAYRTDQIAQRAFSNQTGRMQYLRQVRHDADTLALGMTKGAISEQLAQERIGLTARVAALREVGVDSRFAQDVELRTSIKKLDAQNIAASGQIKAIIANSSLTSQQQSAAIQAIQTKMDDAYQKTLAPIASRHPDVSARMAEVESEIESGTEAGDANDAGMSPGADPYSASSGSGVPSVQQKFEQTRQSLGGGGTEGGPTSQSGARPSWTPPPADVVSIGSNAWLQAGGPPQYAPLAGVIATMESSGNPRNINPAGTGVGLFQINPQAHPDLAAKYNLLDPVQNARAAVELFNAEGAQPWRESMVMPNSPYGGWGPWAAANGYLGPNGIMAPAQTPQTGAQPKLGLAPQPGQLTRTTGQPPNAGSGTGGGAQRAQIIPPDQFAAGVQGTIKALGTDPNGFNDAEQKVKTLRQQGRITPQMEQQALAQMESTRRSMHGAAQPGDPAAALRGAAQQDAAAPNAPAQPPPPQAPAAPTPEEQRAARMRAAVAAEPAHGVDLTPQVASPNAAPLGTRRPAPASGQPLISPIVQRAIQAYFALTTPEAKAQFLARQAPLLKKALQDMLAQGTRNTLTPPAM
jgi:hypothetical protein